MPRPPMFFAMPPTRFIRLSALDAGYMLGAGFEGVETCLGP